MLHRSSDKLKSRILKDLWSRLSFSPEQVNIRNCFSNRNAVFIILKEMSSTSLEIERITIG